MRMAVARPCNIQTLRAVWRCSGAAQCFIQTLRAVWRCYTCSDTRLLEFAAENRNSETIFRDERYVQECYAVLCAWRALSGSLFDNLDEVREVLDAVGLRMANVFADEEEEDDEEDRELRIQRLATVFDEVFEMRSVQ